MGRLKKDHSNYKTSGLWIKYKDIEDVNRHIPRKNKRRWCKGRVGIEHNYKFIEQHKFHVFNYYTLICSVCGKKNIKDGVYGKNND